jgi:hypothetical protein
MFRSNVVTSKVVARLMAGPASMILLVIAAGGCSSAEEVTPEIELLDRTTQALGVGVLEWVNGTYGAGCVTRSGAWSARISGSAGMDNPALSVIMNNTACVLTLTELVGTDTYLATPDIALGASYAGSASTFAIDGEALAFYANAKLDSLAFASNFTLTIPFSDDPGAASGSTSATYASVSSTGNQAQQVLAPDYAVGFGSLVLRTDVDQVVTTASGTVSLSLGSQAGEFYVVNTNASLGSDFADIDAAYAAGTPAAVAATIPAASFSLGGTTLPEHRNIIILHASNGVKAYQVVTITFNVATE